MKKIEPNILVFVGIDCINCGRVENIYFDEFHSGDDIRTLLMGRHHGRRWCYSDRQELWRRNLRELTDMKGASCLED